jgi:uncharacterized membrane protein YhaH (DUF805 family)
MDWKNLFLTADSRIGKRDFWIGFLILFVANIVLSLIPVIGWLVSLALMYPMVCLYSKRLHDFGKTGWLTLVPFVAFFGAMVVGGLTGGMALLGMGAAGSDAAAASAAVAGLGMFGGLMALAGLISLGFLLWVGLTNGDPGENRYGLPPVSLTGGPASPPTVV